MQTNEQITSSIPKMRSAIEKYGILQVLQYLFVGEIKVEILLTGNALDMSIDNIDFSPRIKNCFHRASPAVLTVKDIANLIELGSLSSIKGFGRNCDNEVKTYLLVLSWESLNEQGKNDLCRYLLEENTVSI